MSLKPVLNRIFVPLLLMFFGAIIPTVTAEVFFRATTKPDRFVWIPNIRKVFEPDLSGTPGLFGESRFSTNSSGIRGDEFNVFQGPRMLAMGGSTTECLFLDDAETWPSLLQQKLKLGALGKNVWVGNVGKSGKRSRHVSLQIEELIPQYPHIDRILVLSGVNDLLIRLSRGTEIDPEVSESPAELKALYEAAFDYMPGPDPNPTAWYESLLVVQRLQRLLKTVSTPESKRYLQSDAQVSYQKWREFRKHPRNIVAALPNLEVALARYRRNLERTVESAKARGVVPLLITQPTLWKPNQSTEEEKLLWTGGIGDFQSGEGFDYYSTGALSKAMELYNNELLAVCRDKKIECIDLAALVPKTTHFFYDDCHFTERGALLVAESLAQVLEPS